ncbi:MAG: tRNA glutamyl-Q(34) synthetase GluQRS [Allosphingosinicella sp.]
MTAWAATQRQEPSRAKGVVSRFAPSPTGRLHLGHAYSCLLAHDYARTRGGAFLLRIEDIDPGRTREAFVEAIVEDLAWLGLGWDGEVVRQSHRLPLYAEALERLKARGLVYPCFCTRAAIAAEIAASAAAPHPGSGSGAGGPDGPLYPGTCRGLSADERDARLAEPHAWRLDAARAAAAAGPLYWKDGDTEVLAEPLGDVVLARKDAPVSYHLAVTLDDAAQGVTDVVRGRDLYAATDVHRLLQALLGLPTPLYHHHPLLTDGEGRRLAKRHGAPALADLRASGADPRALVAALRRGQLPGGYSVAGG